MTLLFFLAVIGVFLGIDLARWTAKRIPYEMKQSCRKKLWIAGVLKALGNIIILGLTVCAYLLVSGIGLTSPMPKNQRD